MNIYAHGNIGLPNLLAITGSIASDHGRSDPSKASDKKATAVTSSFIERLRPTFGWICLLYNNFDTKSDKSSIPMFTVNKCM